MSGIETGERILKYQSAVEQHLESFLPEAEGPESDLVDVIRYSLSGGKRLRPVLTLACAEAVGGIPESVLPAAMAIEFIHTCSLILDDLPSMDDASSRRDRAATHQAFGESTAILASHALLTHAFKLLALNASDLPVPKETAVDVVVRVASCLGISGLTGGQYLDLQAASRGIDPSILGTIHSRKTAALFVAAAHSGAALSGADGEVVARLQSYAELVGRAFQTIDDLIDREVSAHDAATGSRAGDRSSADEVRRLTERAKEMLNPLGEKAVVLEHYADMVVSRSP